MKAFLGLGFLVAITLVGGSAFSQEYVRTTTCGPSTIPCRQGQQPLPLSWPTNCVHFLISSAGSSQFKDELGERLPPEALEAVRDGFYAWNDVETSSFQYKYDGLTERNTPKKGSGNAVYWRDRWDQNVPNALAITTVNYLPSTGQIVSATMEINTSSNFRVTFPPMTPSSDLQNTVTHEAGHFLGLAHTTVRDATMFGQSPKGEITKRILKDVDKEGVSAIYPAAFGPACVQIFEEDETTLDGLRRNNLDSDGCSSTPRPAQSLFTTLLFIVGLLFTRRRSKNS